MLKPSIIAALSLAAVPLTPAATQVSAPAHRPPATYDSVADRTQATAPAMPDSLAIANDQAQRMTVMVSVGGQGPFAFLVDTGSERTAISRQLATRLGLSTGTPVRVHSVLGAETVDTVNIPRLAVGKQALSVTDAPMFEARHIGASGILGIDSLRSQRVLFDFKAQEMRIAPSGRGEVTLDRDVIVVRARSRGGRLVLTKATLDGVGIAAIVDTGSQVSVGNLALLRKLQRAGRVAPDTDRNGVAAERPLLESVTGETRPVDVKLVRRIDLGDVDVENLPVAFADAQVFRQLGYANKPALLLGIDAMRLFDKVSIDFQQKKIRFVLPKVALAPEYQTASR